jgi:holo-[acyl-carrier protein] synthase
LKSHSIFGIGVDIIEVRRIKAAIVRNPAIINRIFTDEEIRYCSSRNNKITGYICYAQRFAAKEAVSKALGTGFGTELFLTEVEIRNSPAGKPFVRLYGKSREFAERNKIVKIEISVSGTEENAIAFSIAFL